MLTAASDDDEGDASGDDVEGRDDTSGDDEGSSRCRFVVTLSPVCGHGCWCCSLSPRTGRKQADGPADSRSRARVETAGGHADRTGDIQYDDEPSSATVTPQGTAVILRNVALQLAASRPQRQACTSSRTLLSSWCVPRAHPFRPVWSGAPNRQPPKALYADPQQPPALTWDLELEDVFAGHHASCGGTAAPRDRVGVTGFCNRVAAFRHAGHACRGR